MTTRSAAAFFDKFSDGIDQAAAAARRERMQEINPEHDFTGDYIPAPFKAERPAYRKFSNLFPDDLAIPGPRYKLVIMESGAYKYRLPSGELRTPKGSYDYIQIGNDTYVAPPKSDPNISGHLSLSGGRDVDYAGTMRFSHSGNLKNWTNDSGHYRPNAKLSIRVPLPQDLFRPNGTN